MSKDIYTFEGGTDLLLQKMTYELLKSGVVIFKRSKVEKILLENNKVKYIHIEGKDIPYHAVLSNAYV
jgi:phytoene dehydrogenase-like protein